MGSVKILQGDCFEKMKALSDGSIDFVLTDMPYKLTGISWDIKIDLKKVWIELKRVVKKNSVIALTGAHPFTSELILSNLEMFKYCWYWQFSRSANFGKAPYMPLKVIEEVVIFSAGAMNKKTENKMIYNPQDTLICNKVCQGKKSNEHRKTKKQQKPYMQIVTNYPTQILKFEKPCKPLHPTQKPVALLEYLIKTYTNKNDVVLDFTMGSGSTGVACINTDRNFIGIELDEKYFNIAKNRINKVIQRKESIQELF